MARGHYRWKRQKDTLHVRAHAPRLRVEVPPGTREIVLTLPESHQASLAPGEAYDVAARTPAGGVLDRVRVSDASRVIDPAGTACCEIALDLPAGAGADAGTLPEPGVPRRGRARARRLLAESRDRLLPLLPGRRWRAPLGP
jgi:hypothetical protein